LGASWRRVALPVLSDIQRIGGLQGRDLANIFDTSTASVSRWINGLTSPGIDTQTLLSDLRYVAERLSDFYTPDEVRLWLHAEHPLLNGERPIDLIRNRRTKEVIATIDRLDAGSYL
jgi:hypothetical protein